MLDTIDAEAFIQPTKKQGKEKGIDCPAVMVIAQGSDLTQGRTMSIEIEYCAE